MSADRKLLQSELSQVVLRNMELELRSKMNERGFMCDPTATMLIDYLDAHKPSMLLSAISDALEEVLTARGVK